MAGGITTTGAGAGFEPLQPLSSSVRNTLFSAVIRTEGSINLLYSFIVQGLVFTSGSSIGDPDCAEYIQGLLLTVQQPFGGISGLSLGLKVMAELVTGVFLVIKCHRKPGKGQQADRAIHNQHDIT
ncbi:MAG TPA: hypothetical protein DIS97_16600 [Citrobacter freundii]|nr:hypothetical protein [Citrobacter freundii]